MTVHLGAPGSGRLVADPFASVVDLVPDVAAAAAAAAGEPVEPEGERELELEPGEARALELRLQNPFLARFRHRIPRSTFMAMRKTTAGTEEDIQFQNFELEQTLVTELRRIVTASHNFEGLRRRIERNPAESPRWMLNPDDVDIGFLDKLEDLVEFAIKLRIGTATLQGRSSTSRDATRMRYTIGHIRRIIPEKYYSDSQGRIHAYN